MFCIFFAKNLKIQNGGHKKFFRQMGIVDDLDTLWVENFDEIALSRSVKEIAKYLSFAFSQKIRKFKMAAPKNFGGKLRLVDDLYILWIENFDEIALSRSVKEIAKFLCFAFFCEKFENSKWWPQKNFRGNGHSR